jgi:hypothetical protein
MWTNENRSLYDRSTLRYKRRSGRRRSRSRWRRPRHGDAVRSSPFLLLKLCADGGYQGPQFKAALQRVLRQVNLEIVKRSDSAKTFSVLPKRWIVKPLQENSVISDSL